MTLRHEHEHVFRNSLTIEVKLSADLIALLNNINKNLRLIIMTQAEHAEELRGIKDQLTKANAEIINKIGELEKVIADNTDGAVSEEVKTVTAELKALVKGTDDIVPDQQQR